MSFSLTITQAFAFDTEEELKASVRRYMSLTQQPPNVVGELEATGEAFGALNKESLTAMQAQGITAKGMVMVISMREEQQGAEYRAIPLGATLAIAPAAPPPT